MFDFGLKSRHFCHSRRSISICPTLYHVSVICLLVESLVCGIFGVMTGGLDGNDIVGVVEDGFLHHMGWVRIVQQAMKRMVWVSRLMSEVG